MNQLERERLVERYLSGDLSPHEEQEFFIQVAVDNYLRQTLKAYRIIENAMRKDRDGIPPGHSDLRARVMGIWAIRNLGPAPTPPSTTHVPSLMEGFNFGRLVSTLGMTKWMVSVAGVAAVAVGVFLTGTLTSHREGPVRPAPRTEAAHQPVQEKSAEPKPQLVQTPPASAAVEDVGSQETAPLPVEHVAKEEKRREPSTPRAEQTDLRRVPTVSASTDRDQKPSEGAVIPDDGWKEETHHPRLSTSDTINLHLKVTLPKQ